MTTEFFSNDGLTRKGKKHVPEYLAGKQIKEIACDNRVFASTALSLAYKKLRISGGAELTDPATRKAVIPSKRPTVTSLPFTAARTASA